MNNIYNNNYYPQHKIINGVKISEKILEETAKLVSLKDIRPRFAIIFVGNNKNSEIYVNKKLEAAQKCGVEVSLFKLKSSVNQKELEKLLKNLNNNPQIGSIIIQLPLPKHINTNKLIRLISPNKDLDGFHPQNINNKNVYPIIGDAVLEIFKEMNFQTEKKTIAIVTKQSPLTNGLNKIFHKNKVIIKNLIYPTLKLNKIRTETKYADIIITALGKPKYLNEKHIKEGSFIIDIGISRKNNKICGDADFEKVIDKVSFITPVPGGVGPITVACAIRKAVNLYIANCK